MQAMQNASYGVQELATIADICWQGQFRRTQVTRPLPVRIHCIQKLLLDQYVSSGLAPGSE